MSQRRLLPAAPFWAMLAAVWTLLVLGAVPPRPHDVLCGTAERQHAPAHGTSDCLACCSCTVAGAAQAVAADTPALPGSRGTALATVPALPRTGMALAPQPFPRARAPPPFA